MPFFQERSQKISLGKSFKDFFSGKILFVFVLIIIYSFFQLPAGELDQGVNHLTKAIAVCNQPQQLLNLFHTTLPEHIFQLLLEKLNQMAPTQQQVSKKSPLSPSSDQRQISPCNINAYSTPEVMRIKDMITTGGFS